MKPSSIGWMFFLFLIFLTPTARKVWAQSADYKPAMMAANQDYLAQKYDVAISEYQSAIQLDPNAWPAYQGLGNCFYMKSQDSNALSAYQTAYSINSNNPPLARRISEIETKLGVPQTIPNSALVSTPPSEAQTASKRRRTTGEASARPRFEIDLGPDLAAVLVQGQQSGFGGGNVLGFGAEAEMFFNLPDFNSIGFSILDLQYNSASSDGGRLPNGLYRKPIGVEKQFGVGRAFSFENRAGPWHSRGFFRGRGSCPSKFFRQGNLNRERNLNHPFTFNRHIDQPLGGGGSHYEASYPGQFGFLRGRPRGAYFSRGSRPNADRKWGSLPGYHAIHRLGRDSYPNWALF